jgi:hypothetical protein
VTGFLLTYSWGHYWHNDHIGRSDLPLITLIDANIQGLTNSLDTQWGVWVFILFLGAAAYLIYLTRWFFIQYLGDVAAYVSAHTVNRFFEVREQIQRVGLKVADAVYSAEENGKPLYDKIIVLGHSLGSIIAYDTLNGMINNDLLHGEKRRVVERTNLFLTFGSPMDKIAFIFRTQAQNAIVREVLAAAKQPMIDSYDHRPQLWINLWSPKDWISGSIDYFDDPLELDNIQKRVKNYIDLQADKPILAHTQYWGNDAVGEVLYAACTGDLDGKMQKLQEANKVRPTNARGGQRP